MARELPVRQYVDRSREVFRADVSTPEPPFILALSQATEPAWRA